MKGTTDYVRGFSLSHDWIVTHNTLTTPRWRLHQPRPYLSDHRTQAHIVDASFEHEESNDVWGFLERNLRARASNQATWPIHYRVWTEKNSPMMNSALKNVFSLLNTVDNWTMLTWSYIFTQTRIWSRKMEKSIWIFLLVIILHNYWFTPQLF